MILDCDACLAKLQDKPRYSRSKVGLSDVNGVACIVLINAKVKEKLKIANIQKLYQSSIAFKNPDVNLMIKNADAGLLKLLFAHLRKLVNGEKVHKLPDFEQIKNEKPKVTSMHQVGNDFDLSVLKRSQLNRLTIERATQVLPRQIWNLNHLTELNLVDCNLDALPDRLTRLGKTLKLLNLSGNRLEKIDKLFFARMPNLVSMNLANNRIAFIPLDIVLSKNLVSLDLSNNRLTALPYTLIYLRKLADLNVRSNRIELFSSAIWTSIGSKMNLTRLDISGNQSTEHVNRCLDQHRSARTFRFPTLRQLASNSAVRKPQLFCNLSDYLPRTINDEIEENTDLCAQCKKPFAGTKFFDSTHLFAVCDLAKGPVLTEEPSIWLCRNLCSVCKFNSKFKRLDLL